MFLEEHFRNMYRGMHGAVLVCRDDERRSLVYANYAALMILDPAHKLDSAKIAEYSLITVLLPVEIELNTLLKKIEVDGVVDELPLVIWDSWRERKQLIISANLTTIHEDALLIFYIKDMNRQLLDEGRFNRIMSLIYEIASYSEDYNETIQNILGVCGSTTKVSRTYIIEPTSSNTCSNTYEWCNMGVAPMGDTLQKLDPDAYEYLFFAPSHDVIARHTGNITDKRKREILQGQGIRSLSVVPVIYQGVTVGYWGFDDCEQERDWDETEISLLKGVASVLASLIVRRNEKLRTDRTLAVMQTVTDSIGSPIMVNTMDTHEILFINDAMRKSLLLNPSVRPESLIGTKCYEAMQPDGTGPCPNCPVEHMKDERGDYLRSSRYRECYTAYTEQWFEVQDRIVEWTDGRLVHIESGLEITERKKNEAKLTELASIDYMTGIYKREWGYKILQEAVAQEPGVDKSLVFMDLDGLKHVNDTLGHSVGDEMITTFVALVRAGLSEDCRMIRWGGDEFLVLMNVTPEQAEARIEAIQMTIDEFNRDSEQPFQVSFSHGVVAFSPDSKKMLDQLITIADEKMYEKKACRKQRRSI